MVEGITGVVALLLEYDGTNYGGWQYQDNADTVQQSLEESCRGLFGAQVKVRGASRTDAGVHARGQVAAFTLPRPFHGGKLVAALNWHLPRDIRIKEAFSVPLDFNPVAWARGKIYRYFIFQRQSASALGEKYCWHLPRELDLAAMNEAARHCIGSRDFASFQAAGSPVASTRRRVMHLFCHRRGDWLAVTCVGDGFLYNMVRILVGTLVEFGLGKGVPGGMESIIAARERAAAGPTAPAKGLFLEKVLYRPSLDSYPRL